jgi:peptidoglycan/LPS O-acetylase OafA/YrhL
MQPFGLIPQANALGVGALGAIYFSKNKIPAKLLSNKRIEYVALFLLIFFLFTNFQFKYIACPIISLFLILKTAHNGFSISWFNNFLNNKHIIYIGSISYGIYVFHLPLGHYFTEYIFNPYFWEKINWNSLGVFKKLQWHSWVIKLPLFSFLSILLAHFSFKYFEKPILSLKDKWFKYTG